MKVLTFSDEVVSFIYSPSVRQRFGGVDLIIDCGDTPYGYLEFVVSALNVPAFYVRGNHSMKVTPLGGYAEAHGAVDLHGKVINQSGVLFAGIEGCLRYSPGPYQYSQLEMWLHAARLIPGLLWNRVRYGRYLDILVTHAPPWGIHDQPDLPHRGIKAFRWLLQVFKPSYHFHGHIHTYRPDAVSETRFGHTQVINTYPYRMTELKLRWER